MRRTAALLATAPLLLGAMALSAEDTGETQPAPACEDTGPREALTTDGATIDFDAPDVTAPELVPTAEATHDVSPHRRASFYFYADLAPYDAADLDADLSWEQVGNDFDVAIYVNGSEFAATATFNQLDQNTVESASASVNDCDLVRIVASSWASSPAEPLTLDLTITPDESTRDSTETAREDDREILYLHSDRPGQAGPATEFYVGDDSPFHTHLVPERPTTGSPNQYTRPALGFADQHNPFQPYWSQDFFDVAAIPHVKGDASALVWLSSPTMAATETGTIEVELFLSGVRHAVTLEGVELSDHPTPFLVTFPDVDVEQVFDVTVQASAEPVVSSTGGESEDPGDLSHTVWFDSIQYQSRVHLPVVSGSFLTTG